MTAPGQWPATARAASSPPAAPGPPKLSFTAAGVVNSVGFGGGAPYLVNGVLQVNITIPGNAPTGDAVPLVITVGGVDSQPGVTIAIQ